MEQFKKESEFSVSVEELFDYHQKPNAFERLTPPWVQVELVRQDPGMDVGKEVVLRLWKGPFWKTWHLKHTEYDPPYLFTDTQISGPFKCWQHRHRFSSISGCRSQLSDEIEYQLPFNFFGDRVRRDLDKLFTYRHRVLRNDLNVLSGFSLAGCSLQVEGDFPFLRSRFEGFAKLAGALVNTVKDPDAQLWLNTDGVRLKRSNGMSKISELPLSQSLIKNDWERTDQVCYNLAQILCK